MSKIAIPNQPKKRTLKTSAVGLAITVSLMAGALAQDPPPAEEFDPLEKLATLGGYGTAALAAGVALAVGFIGWRLVRKFFVRSA